MSRIAGCLPAAVFAACRRQKLSTIFAEIVLCLLGLAACVSPAPGVAPAVEPTPFATSQGPAMPARPTDRATLQRTQPAQQLITAAPTSGPSIGGLSPSTPDCDCVPTPKPAFDPESWQTLPVLPQLNAHALAILAEGQERGSNPHAFSKIGDCESRTTWFLGNFDLGEEYYNLGPYAEELGPVVVYYAGSFNRLSQAANPGFTAASLLSPLRADPKSCEKAESPLACEYRQHKPAVAFILLGTNDAVNPKTFEGHMRKIIDYTLAQGTLPILGTKADNIEGDHSINQTIARLAFEYDLPLWNYWLAVQDLPGHGLQEDGSHLTYAGPFFNDPAVLKRAWPVRNLNALQILNETMKASQGE